MLPLDLRFFSTGYCTHPEIVTTPGGKWRSAPAYGLCALFSHPEKGEVLIDTGYAPRFDEATRQFPERLYALTTPTHIAEGDALIEQLPERVEGYRTIILTHFHGDHVAGCRDFPQATFIYLESGYAAMAPLSRFQATRAAFLPALLPDDFLARSNPIPDTGLEPLPAELNMHPFDLGVDLFGDGLVWGIPLPGHAVGQMGVLLREDNDVFLCADACWHSKSYRENRFPHHLGRLAQADMTSYLITLDRLHQLHRRRPTLPILPFHCPEVVERYIHSKNSAA